MTRTQTTAPSAPRSRFPRPKLRGQALGGALAIALAGCGIAGGVATQARAQSMPAPLNYSPQPTPDTGAAAAASAPGLNPSRETAPLPALAEGVLVSVNDDIVSSYDLKQRMLLLMATSGVQVTQENYAAFQQQALRSLIDERLQRQEMTHWKVKIEDKEIDQELTRMAAQSNMTKDQMVGELKKIGIEPKTLRDQVSAQIGWNELVGGRYHSNAQVGRDQVDATMDKIIENGQKQQYEVSEIFLDPTTAGSMENALKGAKQLSDQLNQKVAPFQAVARQFSNASSAANGGDEGWMVSGSMDPQIEAVLSSMKPGDISAPVQTKEGVYIFYLRAKSDGNADEVAHLKQAAVPLRAGATPADISAAQATLIGFKSRAPSCSAVDDVKSRPQGVQVTDLGEAQLSDLLPQYAEALHPLKSGQSTGPLRNSANVNVLYVCDKRLAGPDAQTREEVQSSLVNTRLAMLGKRYLRDLYNTATIEMHQ